MRPECTIFTLRKGGKCPSIFCWPFLGLICARNPRFPSLKGGNARQFVVGCFGCVFATGMHVLYFKRGETLLNFVLAVLGAHLPPECTISTYKRGETPIMFLLDVFGSHLRPECTISIPKRGDTPLSFLFFSCLPPRGGPGEGPDCHFPKGNYDFGPNSARIRRDFN